MVKLLAFSGSARKDSYNQKLVTIAAREAEAAGAEVTLINLADYPMPLFNQDLEADEGPNEHVKAFKQLLIEHDGMLIASPEYNSAFTPLLKNAIDWASRAHSADEPPLAAFRGKTAGLMSTAPGAIGGMRGLVFLRMLLGNIGVHILPQQHCIGFFSKAFNAEGELVEERDLEAIRSLTQNLVQLTEQIKKP